MFEPRSKPAALTSYEHLGVQFLLIIIKTNSINPLMKQHCTVHDCIFTLLTVLQEEGDQYLVDSIVSKAQYIVEVLLSHVSKSS